MMRLLKCRGDFCWWLSIDLMIGTIFFFFFNRSHDMRRHNMVTLTLDSSALKLFFSGWCSKSIAGVSSRNWSMSSKTKPLSMTMAHTRAALVHYSCQAWPSDFLHQACNPDYVTPPSAVNVAVLPDGGIFADHVRACRGDGGRRFNIEASSWLDIPPCSTDSMK